MPGYADNDGDGVLEKDGKKLSLKLITYQANAALPMDCEALASQLSQIGIAADIEVAEKITVRLPTATGTLAPWLTPRFPRQSLHLPVCGYGLRWHQQLWSLQ